MTFQIPYTGNLTWLVERTILYVRAGSHSYGTNIATSDEDYRGIAVPPREYLHGFQLRFDQAESNKPDSTIYALAKFLRLACDGNPGLLEMIWCDASDQLVVTPQGQRLLDARELFLSKSLKHRFSGYAISQLKRIRTHRRWLLNPPDHQPTRAEYGLPERTVIPADQLQAANAVIQKQLASWEPGYTGDLEPGDRVLIQQKMADILAEIAVNSVADQYAPAARACGLSENFIEIALKEREYTAKTREFQQYQNWKATRNETRAGLEADHGYDTKHGMHLVRLMRTCREVLETGRIQVKRPDAEELLAIRNGAWDYDRLVSWAEAEDTALNEVMKTSKLPAAPDRKKLDALCLAIVESML